MEVGTEISQKIRSAIKAKLMELGAYVDDELPDYIMVMVANKKNISQMKADLSLFLGGNTETFTSWLHGLLGKLQTITVESSKDKNDKPKSSKDKKKDKGSGQKSKNDSTKGKKAGKEKSRKRKSSRDGVEDAPKAKVAVSNTVENENSESQSQNPDIAQASPNQEPNKGAKVSEMQLSQELKSSRVTENEPQANEASNAKQASVQEEIEDVRQLLVASTPGDELAQELDAAEEEVSSVVKTSSRSTNVSTKVSLNKTADISLESHSHREQKVKRKVPSSVVASVSRGEDEEEYDPFNPAVGSVASVVKVTSRKTAFPQSMQANRALLVKAMSDAEKSVATRRKVAVTRPINRQPSPGEYSPKRKRSTSHREAESPPPYIPSRKTGVSARVSSQSSASASDVAVSRQQRVLSRDDIRHSLGHEDSRGLTSASRREEILRKTGGGAASSASFVISSKSQTALTSAHSSSSRVQPRSNLEKESTGSGTKVTDRITGPYGREVRGLDRSSGGVKNFQITARVGPLRLGPPKEISSKRDDSTPAESDSEQNLRVTVRSGHSNIESSIPKAEVGLKTVVNKSQLRSTLIRDVREDLHKLKQGKSLAEGQGRTTRVISRLAREAVQKQCKAAVMSVRAASQSQSSSNPARAGSPDSRVVHCDSRPSSVSSQQGEEDSDIDTGATEVKFDSGSDTSDTKVVVRKSPEIIAKSVGTASASSRLSSPLKKDVEEAEVEDLSQMLEEDLDSELLLEDNKNEFTLDLDDEELSHVVEEVAAELETEHESTDDGKSGIRFIVTLDGVDEAQFDDKTTGKPERSSNIASVRASHSQPILLSQGHHSVSTLPPSAPARLSLAASQPSTPFTPTSLAQTASKMRPPKIQPFSISLRDSDDEHEEKIVTYVQATDVSVLETVPENLNEGEEPVSALQQARSQERCRFWPACMAGTDCQYHHPTTHCKTFPNCKFGDKCLFIHPNCRFDSKCVRADCPYTHTSKRHPSQLVASMPMPLSRPYPRYHAAPQPMQNITCHFFPNCLNPTCQFLHPKSCMYGPACKNPTCTFYHPVSVSSPAVTSTVPDKGKLKWQAPPSAQSKLTSVKPAPARSAAVSSTSL
ncbi:hypothetical protein EGW08_003028 [Elysia chlorotica]|uniref:Zinc finger CCCH domain-containing protein 14 n=1 Tax=Elysia chlorotica TaxID=188477 RepID=A0A433U6A2_ELYCH|nr:hypothetical protein EGW08_003028 [Elysia chlorotica]